MSRSTLASLPSPIVVVHYQTNVGFCAWFTDTPHDFQSGCSSAGHTSKREAFLDVSDPAHPTPRVADLSDLADAYADLSPEALAETVNTRLESAQVWLSSLRT